MTQVSLPDEIAERLQVVADRQKRTLSEVLADAVAQYVERKAQNHTQSTGSFWETCEIVCQYYSKAPGFLGGYADVMFTARVLTQNGLSDGEHSATFKLSKLHFDLGIRESPPNFLPSADDNTMQVLNSLIQHLTSDGWEPTGRGSAWFNHKFRRGVKRK